MPKPSVSLCMIVRNEETNLHECLAQVADLVQEIVIVDTGSTDGTRKIAEGFGAKIVDFTWVDDFSAARNQSISQASGDWIFWLDADDRIDDQNRNRLREVFSKLGDIDASDLPVVMMSCVSNCSVSQTTIWQSHGRLFPRNPGLIWQRRVHECLSRTQGSDPLLMIPTDVVIRHEGYRDKVHTLRKQLRDLRILEQEYAVDPDDTMTLLYLGRIRLSQNRTAEALRFLQRSIRSDETKSLATTAQAYLLATSCLAILGHADEAVQLNDEATAAFPDDLSLLYQRGCLFHDANRMDEAEMCFRRLVSLPAPICALSGTQPDLQTVKARMNLGHVYSLQDRHAEAIAEYEMAMKADPLGGTWFYLAREYLVSGRRLQFGAALGRLQQDPNSGTDCLLLQAMACIEDKRFAEARNLIGTILSVCPNSLMTYEVYADLLNREGLDLELCIEIHRKALELGSLRRPLRERLNKLLETQKRRRSPAALEEFHIGATRGGTVIQPCGLGSAQIALPC